MFFFFQAEDGIRDLVRSRGLGDVYKRQGVAHDDELLADNARKIQAKLDQFGLTVTMHEVHAVSYTHLTLPTSDLV